MAEPDEARQTRSLADAPETMDAPSTRLIGFVALLVGAACLLWMWYAHRTGGSIPDKVLLAGPLVLVIGLVTAMEPRFMMAILGKPTPENKRFKTAGLVIYAVGIMAALVVRFTLFKDWR